MGKIKGEIVCNGVIAFNKPQNMTSHDIVSLIRKLSKIQRIGHTGTLDPMAEGVLVLFVGNWTKLISYVEKQDKIYRAKIKFGLTTDTQDIWGTEIPYKNAFNSEEVKIYKDSYDLSDEQIQKNLSELDESKVNEALKSFVGKITQFAPAYSAVKSAGKKLYELARKGEEIPIKERHIIVRSIDIVSQDYDTKEIEVVVKCSKGTYIRTIADNLGKKLGTGAVLSALTREFESGFSIQDTVSFEEMIQHFNDGGKIDGLFKSYDILFPTLQKIELGKLMTNRFTMGTAIEMPYFEDGICLAFNEGKFLGVGKIVKGIMSPIKVLIKDVK